jgi:WD40 repeat protein
MPNFDRRLTDPTADAVAAALEQAAKDANSRARLGRLTPDSAAFRAAAEACVREPTGVRRWVEAATRDQFVAGATPTTLVGLAWWADPMGKRHVWVVGRRVERTDNRHPSLFGPRDEDRPGLWLLQPDRLFLRTRGGERQLVAVCACGAVGTPAALGWWGEYCGPCHDRQEEGTPIRTLPLPGTGTLAGHVGPIAGLAFAPGGGMLAAPSIEPYTYRYDEPPSGQVLFTDVRTGKAVRMVQTWSETRFAGGGNRAAAVFYRSLSLYDLTTSQDLASRRLTADETVIALAVAPDGATLALGLQGRRVRTYDLSAGNLPAQPAQTFEAAASSLAFSPDGKMLAVGAFASWVHLFPLGAGEARHLRVEDGRAVRAVAFDRAGGRLVAGTGPRPPQYDRPAARTQQPGQVYLWDLSARTPRGTPLQSHPGGVLAVAFSPDEKFVVSAGLDRAVRFWDVAAGKEAVALEWHLADVTALAFSPDGQTLATGSEDGTVKLWPWQRLLEEEAQPARGRRARRLK